MNIKGIDQAEDLHSLVGTFVIHSGITIENFAKHKISQF